MAAISSLNSSPKSLNLCKQIFANDPEFLQKIERIERVFEVFDQSKKKVQEALTKKMNQERPEGCTPFDFLRKQLFEITLDESAGEPNPEATTQEERPEGCTH